MNDEDHGSTMADAVPEAPPTARARDEQEGRLAAFGRQVASLDQRRRTLAAERDDLVRAAVAAGMSHSQIAAIAHVNKANVGFIALREPVHVVAHDPDRLTRMGAEVKALDVERDRLIRHRDVAIMEAIGRYDMHYERVARLIGQTRANVGLIAKKVPNGSEPS